MDELTVRAEVTDRPDGARRVDIHWTRIPAAEWYNLEAARLGSWFHSGIRVTGALLNRYVLVDPMPGEYEITVTAHAPSTGRGFTGRATVVV